MKTQQEQNNELKSQLGALTQLVQKMASKADIDEVKHLAGNMEPEELREK